VIIAAIIAKQGIPGYETTIRLTGVCRCSDHVSSRRLALWLTTLTDERNDLSIENRRHSRVVPL